MIGQTEQGFTLSEEAASAIMTAESDLEKVKLLRSIALASGERGKQFLLQIDALLSFTQEFNESLEIIKLARTDPEKLSSLNAFKNLFERQLADPNMQKFLSPEIRSQYQIIIGWCETMNVDAIMALPSPTKYLL